MCERLFSRPAAIQCHHTGPLADERTAYLARLAAQGTPRATMRIRAHYCLRIARELEHWPQDHTFTPADIETMATAWAAQSVASGRAATPTNPAHMFRIAAVAFLRALGRLCLAPSSPREVMPIRLRRSSRSSATTGGSRKRLAAVGAGRSSAFCPTWRTKATTSAASTRAMWTRTSST